MTTVNDFGEAIERDMELHNRESVGTIRISLDLPHITDGCIHSRAATAGADSRYTTVTSAIISIEMIQDLVNNRTNSSAGIVAE